MRFDSPLFVTFAFVCSFWFEVIFDFSRRHFRQNRFDDRRGTTIADGTIFLHGFPTETTNNNNDDDDDDEHEDQVENRTFRSGTNQFVDPFLFHLLNETSHRPNRVGVNNFLAQLFHQMLIGANEEEGVPPASQNQIDSIPNVRINDKQIRLWSKTKEKQSEMKIFFFECLDEHLQCSVCMEEFLLDERVKRLSCSHHFHDECISNWLRLVKSSKDFLFD